MDLLTWDESSLPYLKFALNKNFVFMNSLVFGELVIGYAVPYIAQNLNPSFVAPFAYLFWNKLWIAIVISSFIFLVFISGLVWLGRTTRYKKDRAKEREKINMQLARAGNDTAKIFLSPSIHTSNELLSRTPLEKFAVQKLVKYAFQFHWDCVTYVVVFSWSIFASGVFNDYLTAKMFGVNSYDPLTQDVAAVFTATFAVTLLVVSTLPVVQLLQYLIYDVSDIEPDPANVRANLARGVRKHIKEVNVNAAGIELLDKGFLFIMGYTCGNWVSFSLLPLFIHRVSGGAVPFYPYVGERFVATLVSLTMGSLVWMWYLTVRPLSQIEKHELSSSQKFWFHWRYIVLQTSNFSAAFMWGMILIFGFSYSLAHAYNSSVQIPPYIQYPLGRPGESLLGGLVLSIPFLAIDYLLDVSDKRAKTVEGSDGRLEVNNAVAFGLIDYCFVFSNAFMWAFFLATEVSNWFTNVSTTTVFSEYFVWVFASNVTMQIPVYLLFKAYVSLMTRAKLDAAKRAVKLGVDTIEGGAEIAAAACLFVTCWSVACAFRRDSDDGKVRGREEA